MKNVNTLRSIVLVLTLVILVLLYFLNRGVDADQLVMREVTSLKDSINTVQNQLKSANDRNEILAGANKNLSYKLYSKDYAKVELPSEEISEDEKAVQSMIKNMESGWAKMMEEKNTKEVLAYFLPEYTTNSVKIDINNKPHVERHNNTDFPKRLQKLVETKDLKFTFYAPEFYSTQVHGNVFTTSYLSHFTTTHGVKLVYKSTILCYVSGEKRDGKWLIGNYNWTRYDDFDASKNQADLVL